MALQAFIDESFDKEDDEEGIFVIGGCIASANSWTNFSKEWKQHLLKFGRLNKNDVYSFKAKEMAQLLELKDERMAAFYRCIERHILGFISCKINAKDIVRARNRIYIPNAEIKWDRFHTYMVAYKHLMDKFHTSRAGMTDAIPLNEKVDFYFDERPEKKDIISFWDDYMKGRPEDIRKLYGATPRFENDNDFLPLQAADFWVWWIRKWYKENTPEKILTRDFGSFKKATDRKFLTIEIVISEDDMVKNFLKSARESVGDDRAIYDIRRYFNLRP